MVRRQIITIIKIFLKSLGLLVLASYGIVAVASLVGHIGLPLGKLGKYGAILYLFCIVVLVPTISSTFVIGFFGALWVKTNRNIGFLISSVLAVFHSFVVLSGQHSSSFGIRVYMVLISIPAIVLSGGLIYMEIQKLMLGKSSTDTNVELNK
jgi:hypothetical protein